MPRSNIVFGPVRSRRFGRSLGVDLSPNKKQCNFDCVYCELQKAKPVDMMNDVIPKEMVIEAIRDAVMSIDSDEIDVLTFSANGEPTLYPYLYEVISAVKGFLPPHIKTLILSNGSKIYILRIFLRALENLRANIKVSLWQRCFLWLDLMIMKKI